MLPERYEILGELGRGGMGIVYKARDRETGEVMALKILKPEIAADLQIIERFKNELRLAHQITHHNVARLYEFHRDGRRGLPFDGVCGGREPARPPPSHRQTRSCQRPGHSPPARRGPRRGPSPIDRPPRL